MRKVGSLFIKITSHCPIVIHRYLWTYDYLYHDHSFFSLYFTVMKLRYRCVLLFTMSPTTRVLVSDCQYKLILFCSHCHSWMIFQTLWHILSCGYLNLSYHFRHKCISEKKRRQLICGNATMQITGARCYYVLRYKS